MKSQLDCERWLPGVGEALPLRKRDWLLVAVLSPLLIVAALWSVIAPDTDKMGNYE